MAALLSTRDSKVLSALFDPESSSSNNITIKPNTSGLPGVSSEQCEQLQRKTADILQPLKNDKATHPPTREEVDAAVHSLTCILESEPKYAPALVDRAQVQRLLLPTELIFTQPRAQESWRVMQDLNSGIALATPSRPAGEPVSALQARTLAAAHTHRGLLLLRLADLRRRGVRTYGHAEAVDGLGPDEIEALASRDFELGGRYGDRIARELAVKTNPYAKMCGAIVREAIQKEIDEAEQHACDLLGEEDVV